MESNEKWKEPIFGFIPEKHRQWYEKNSGTFYDATAREWRIDTTQMHTKYGGKGKEVNVYKANDFQSEMTKMRNLIIAEMGHSGAYMITPDDIFNLMRFGSVEIEYNYQGQKFKKIVKSYTDLDDMVNQGRSGRQVAGKD